MQVNKKVVKPYGDAINDGVVQVSFTLPVKIGPKAREAARRLANEMGLREVDIVEMKDLGEEFSFFVLYGKLIHSVDITEIKVTSVEMATMDYYQINNFIKQKLGRKVTIVGACTGTDAHTVGLDAILNMKGYAGEYGLERYPQFIIYNMGSQVSNEEVIKKAVEVEADSILISQVVTQKNVHIKNLTEMVELLEAEGLRDRFLLIIGGPRISHELALELGFDAGFGRGTLPTDVASYIVQTIVKKKENS